MLAEERLRLGEKHGDSPGAELTNDALWEDTICGGGDRGEQVCQDDADEITNEAEQSPVYTP